MPSHARYDSRCLNQKADIFLNFIKLQYCKNAGSVLYIFTTECSTLTQCGTNSCLSSETDRSFHAAQTLFLSMQNTSEQVEEIFKTYELRARKLICRLLIDITLFELFFCGSCSALERKESKLRPVMLIMPSARCM